MTFSAEHHYEWMGIALDEARAALEHDDVPIGAVLVDGDGKIVAADHNRREQQQSALAHAEILALGAAGSTGWRLTDHTLVVTLEPCAMCAGAIQQSRLARLIYGASDLEAGACWSLHNIPQDARLNHRVEMTAGVRSDECSQLLTDFFAARR